MNKMKEGWNYRKLGELVEVINGLWVGKKPPFINVAVVRNANFTKSCTLDMSNIAYIDVEEKQFKSRELQYADIIIEKSGGSEKQPVGRPIFFNIKENGYSFSNFTATLRVVSSDIIPEYLYKVLLSQYKQGVTKRLQSKTTGLHNLDFKSYLKSVIPVPSCEKQQSIVSELDKISELISLKKEQLSDYDKLAQSLFYEMFGDPVENEKGWEVKKFSEVASFKNGLNFGKNENGHSYKILGVGDFKDNYVVNSSSLEYINLNDELSSDYFLKTEDVVFVRSNGSKELVGRCVSVDCTEPTTYSGFCIRCRLNDNSGVLPMYLLYVCKNKGIREYLTQSGRGCNISNVNQKILNSTDIIIPPLSNQELFIQRIELIEKQKAEIQSTIADLETLLASRMQYWFD